MLTTYEPFLQNIRQGLYELIRSLGCQVREHTLVIPPPGRLRQANELKALS